MYVNPAYFGISNGNVTDGVSTNQPRTQGLPARFFNIAAKAGDALVNAGQLSGKILQESWSISLRVGFMEIKTGGATKSSGI